MRVVLLTAGAVILLAAGIWAKSLLLPPAQEFAMHMGKGSLYDLTVARLSGEPADLSAYKGKVTLVVNVASQCGFTPQYAGLEALYKELAPKGFAVLGFPSNDFGGQEPGSAEEIGQFCQKNYGVTFPMFAKVVTKAGQDQSPSTRSSASRARSRSGTSPSTSSTRTARWPRSFRAASHPTRPRCGPPSRRRWRSEPRVPGPGAPRVSYALHAASTSATVFGIGGPSTRLPDLVTSTSSSIR